MSGRSPSAAVPVMLARMATLADVFRNPQLRRHARGLPYVYPDNQLGYCANFLRMMFKVGDHYRVEPVLEHELEVLFILHADHEQNCSTSAMRSIGSSEADPYCASAGAIGASPPRP